MTTMSESATHRGSALAALAIAILILALLAAPVIAAFWAQNADIQDSLQQLGIYRAEIASKPQLQSELAELDRRGASVPGVIGGDSTALAQAQLQSQLKSVVEASQGAVRSMQPLPAAKQGGFETIAVQCDFSIPESRLKDLAYAISAHKPYLFVDEASITSPPSDPDAAINREQMLDVRWTIHGYRWVDRK